jgi:gliding motility-associated-like protein
LRIFISLLIICFFTLPVQGQIKAPKLVCVQKGSTDIEITWLKPNETCGAFVQYEIYFAPTKSGPFTLLTSITNFNTTMYQHVLTSGSLDFCYYIISKYSCPGTNLTSDTFCSVATLPKPDLLSISIENNFPVYKWIPGSSYPQIWAYAIFDTGRTIDSVYGYLTDTCIDSSFNANSGIYTGNVYATDYCGGTKGRSPFGLYHRPCFLKLNNNPCSAAIDFSWTKYQGWTATDDSKDFEIWIKINSAPEKLISTNASSVLNFSYNSFVYGDTVCIRVKANHPSNPSIYSYSNQICFVSSKSQKPNVLQTLSASYLDNYSIKIRWYCSPSAVPNSFDLIRRSVLNDQKLDTRLNVLFKNEGKGFYSYEEPNGESNQAVKYQVVYQDLCLNKSSGSPAITNFIKVNQVGLYTNEITWPKKYFPDSILYSIKNYDLFFSPDMINYSPIATISAGETKYTHLVENLYQSEGKFCYKLVAHYKFDTMASLIDSSFSESSQLACVLMRTVMWMPNAFKINGYIPVFKPKMYFFSEPVFRMKIYNRWGQFIYETIDPNQGWNGIMSNGQVAPEDSYIYHVSYRGNDGVTVDKTGTFVLMK